MKDDETDGIPDLERKIEEHKQLCIQYVEAALWVTYH